MDSSNRDVCKTHSNDYTLYSYLSLFIYLFVYLLLLNPQWICNSTSEHKLKHKNKCTLTVHKKTLQSWKFAAEINFSTPSVVLVPLYTPVMFGATHLQGGHSVKLSDEYKETITSKQPSITVLESSMEHSTETKRLGWWPLIAYWWDDILRHIGEFGYYSPNLGKSDWLFWSEKYISRKVTSFQNSVSWV